MTLNMKSKKLCASDKKKERMREKRRMLEERFAAGTLHERNKKGSYAISCELIKSVSVDYHHFVMLRSKRTVIRVST